MRLQLSNVDQVKSRKRRAGLSLASASTRAASISAAISAVDPVVLAPSHQRFSGKSAVGAQ